MRTCLCFGLLICGNRDFLIDWGADSDLISKRGERKLQKIKPLHNLLFFGRTGLVTPQRRLPVERNRKSHRQKQAMCQYFGKGHLNCTGQPSL